MRRSGIIFGSCRPAVVRFFGRKGGGGQSLRCFHPVADDRRPCLRGDMHLKDRLTYGLGFGYNYTRTGQRNCSLNYTNSEKRRSPASNPDADIWVFELDGLYHFLPDSPIVPYLEAGAGAVTVDRKRGAHGDQFHAQLRGRSQDFPHR